MIGELLGRFRLVAEAARTDSAVLYRARDEVSGAPAGLTVLGQDAIATLGDIRAFQRRVLTLHGMRSQHVPRPLTAGMEDNVWYVASAGEPGSNLAALARRLGPLPAAEAAALGAQLLRGLSHLHARGIMVRQLRPASAVLGDDGLVRIWGLYGRAGAKDGGKTLSLSQMDFVELTYAPISGEAGGATRGANVYGAGMILAHLLNGGPAVQPKSLPQLFAFAQKPHFDFPGEVPDEVLATLQSAVNPKAAQRPAARSAYGQLLAAAGLKGRQMERIGKRVAVRAAE